MIRKSMEVVESTDGIFAIQFVKGYGRQIRTPRVLPTQWQALAPRMTASAWIRAAASLYPCTLTTSEAPVADWKQECRPLMHHHDLQK